MSSHSQIVGTLRGRLDDADLFRNIGQPLQLGERSAGQIHTWDEWCGPEADEGAALGAVWQATYDACQLADTDALYSQAAMQLVAWVGRYVPYNVREDAWHAPSAACWQAVWSFLLEYYCMSRGLPLQASLAAQLLWFRAGRWPCALVRPDKAGRTDSYVVF